MEEKLFNFGKNINIILKPTTACNMRCSYCYHFEHGYDENKMSLNTFEYLCSIVFPYYENITLIWHGGEPLLMGMDFFVATCNIIDEFLKKYNNRQLKIIIQTNSILINEAWLTFFEQHNIQVGTSFDGITNELTRGSTKEIIKSFDLMQQNSFPVNTVCVITSSTINNLLDNYNFFKTHNIGVKFNPVFKTELTLSNTTLLLESDTFIRKMVDFLSYWFFDTTCNISVEPFIDFCKMAIGKSKSCVYNSCMLSWVCVDWDGRITPCGRNYPSEYILGNIFAYSNIQESFYSEGYLKLLKGAIQRREYCKKNCLIYDQCHGGCNNDALLCGDITKPDIFHCKYSKAMLDCVRLLLKKCEPNISDINPYVKNLILK